MADRSTNANRPARQREPWMDDPNAIRDRRNTPPPPGPPGGGSVWDWSNQEWTDMPNLNPRRPWSRTNPDGTRTGDPNERIDHFPGSASGEWNPNRYRMDENGNWVPRETGYGGIPLNDDGKPIYTPDPVQYPEYFKGSNVQHSQAQQDLWARREAERAAILAADPEYQQAKAAGDRKGMTRAELRLKDQNAQRASGMTPEAWRNRFNTSWPVPRSRNGQYWYRPPGANGPNDPGQPGPTPPGVNSTASTQSTPPPAGPTQVPSSMVNNTAGAGTNTSSQIGGTTGMGMTQQPNARFNVTNAPAPSGQFAASTQNGPTQVPESLTGANRPGFEWRADRRKALRDRDLARTNMDNAANSSAEQRLNQARWTSQGASSLYDKFLKQEQAKMAARKAGGY